MSIHINLDPECLTVISPDLHTDRPDAFPSVPMLYGSEAKDRSIREVTDIIRNIWNEQFPTHRWEDIVDAASKDVPG